MSFPPIHFMSPIKHFRATGTGSAHTYTRADIFCLPLKMRSRPHTSHDMVFKNHGAISPTRLHRIYQV